MAKIIYESELQHHGIIGQKWGIRRFQNKDGSLTAAGKKRYVDKRGDLTEDGRKRLSEALSDSRMTSRSDIQDARDKVLTAGEEYSKTLEPLRKYYTNKEDYKKYFEKSYKKEMMEEDPDFFKRGYDKERLKDTREWWKYEDENVDASFKLYCADKGIDYAKFANKRGKALEKLVTTESELTNLYIKNLSFKDRKDLVVRGAKAVKFYIFYSDAVQINDNSIYGDKLR